MKWTPCIDNGIQQPAIQSGPYRISKAWIGGEVYRYCLFKHGEIVEFADSAEILKQKAARNE